MAYSVTAGKRVLITGASSGVGAALARTLIVWVTIPEYREIPGLWTLPHTAAGKSQIGGPSNAGGLFLS